MQRSQFDSLITLNEEHLDFLGICLVSFESRVRPSVNADVDANNIHGGLSVTVVNGNMDIEDLSGRIRLQSVNGDIDADKLNGDLAIETVNGDIDGKQMNTQGSENELKVSTVNGDIEMESNSYFNENNIFV